MEANKTKFLVGESPASSFFTCLKTLEGIANDVKF